MTVSMRLLLAVGIARAMKSVAIVGTSGDRFSSWLGCLNEVQCTSSGVLLLFWAFGTFGLRMACRVSICVVE